MTRLRVCLVLLALTSGRLAAQDMALREFESQGFAAFRAGDFATCAKAFAKGGAEHPREPSPEFMAARCHARMGQLTSARRHLERALDRGFRNCAGLAGEKALAEFTALRERCETNADAFVRESNPELLAAYLGDRADRSGEMEDVDAIMLRDRSRRDVVRLSRERHLIRTAYDHLHAALIMQHGEGAEDIALARDFARQAVALRPWLAEARWLYAATTDRYLRKTGKPQIFGTQYQEVDGVWTLEPFDPSAVSDEERAKWRTHSLAKRREFIEQLNRESQR